MFFESLLPKAEIGANCYRLDLGGVQVVLDSGMHPEAVGMAALPNFQAMAYDSADAIILSHAHLDHCGSLPVLQRRHPSATVWMSEPTLRLASAMLHNSVNVMSFQREELGVTEYPLFDHDEVDELALKWQAGRLRREVEIADNVTAEFFDAGHILGSTGVLLKAGGKKIFYTGDVNFEDQTICQAASFPTEPLDTVIVECTRGDAPRRPDYTRQSEIERLADAIVACFREGGAVLMPVFAMGKSQEMIVILHELQKSGAIPRCPVIIGGLSTKMSLIYDDFADSSRRLRPGLKVLDLPELAITRKKKRRAGPPKAVEYQPGSIFALSSGMMSEGTVSNDFATSFLGNPSNSLLFVGYADPKTPAGLIKAAKTGDPIQLNQHRPPVELNCQVDSFDFSGHSDREAIRRWVNSVRPKQVLLVHGDEGALKWFETTLKADLPNSEVRIAPAGEKVMFC